MVISQKRRKKFSIRKISRLFWISFLIPLFMFAGKASAQVPTGNPCKIPLVGPGRVVDNDVSGLIGLLGLNVSLLDGRAEIKKLVDGDLSNSIAITQLASVDVISPVVSIRDLKQSYPAGTRAGFMIKLNDGTLSGLLGNGSLLDLDLLNGLLDLLQNNLRIRTYLNNEETGDSKLVSIIRVSELSPTGLQEIYIETEEEFDEIELVTTGVNSSLLSSLAIHYAFVEPAPGCPLAEEPMISTSRFSPSVAVEHGGFVSSEGRVIDNNIDNSATITSGSLLGISVSGEITVKSKISIPAGSQVGFVIGSVSLNLLGGGIIVETNGGDNNSGAGLLGLSLLGDKQYIGFTTTAPCTEITIRGAAGVLGLSAINVYYAFAYIDSDGDGVYDPLDICNNGNDNMDSDGDGIPDECDVCSVNAGTDVYLCSEDPESYDLGAALGLSSGYSWSILQAPSGSNAAINTAGSITGMTLPGTYTIKVFSGTACSDTVNIIRRDVIQNTACNVPIVGRNVTFFTPPDIRCVLCLDNLTGENSGNHVAVIDKDLSNYMEDGDLIDLGLIGRTAIVGVRDNSRTYPAGARAGFVVGSTGGLLNLDLLQGLEIRTYLGGTLQERASVGSNQEAGLLGAELLDAADGQRRVDFVTTKPFDAIVLVKGNLLNVGLLDQSLHVYYAYQQPANSDCSQAEEGDCTQYLQAESDYRADISYANSGITSTLCVGCEIFNVGNLIDDDLNDSTIIRLPVGLDLGALLGALGAGNDNTIASVSVRTPQVIVGAHQAGFTFSPPPGVLGLLNANLLAGISINTYLNGVKQETVSGTNASLLNLAALGAGNEVKKKASLSFLTTLPFDEIQFALGGLLPDLLGDYEVYNAFIRPDSDGDGTPDCSDICCSSNDNLVGDDGLPACGFIYDYDATCRLCPATVVISGDDYIPDNKYLLYRNGNKVTTRHSADTIIFHPDTAGIVQYQLVDSLTQKVVKNLSLNVYPAHTTWIANAGDSNWRNIDNWISDTGESTTYPRWCTNVFLSDSAANYPVLTEKEKCRDITFGDCSSIGKIHKLEYRYAFVDFNVERNEWTMLSAPLRYMYSGDYFADLSWEHLDSPEIFLCQFDVDYSNGKQNPDGIGGRYLGNFSRPFSNLQVPIHAGDGLLLWVTGFPLPDTSFPTGTPYKFPRRDSTNADVLFSYHDEDNVLIGDPFYLQRDNGFNDYAWTVDTVVPDRDNRFRFIFEESMDPVDSTVYVPVQGGRTIMIGNPFISHIDFDQFYMDNQSYIHNYYRAWDSDRFYTYIGDSLDLSGTSWSGLNNLLSTINHPDSVVNQYIAPMQAFFIDVKEGDNIRLKFTQAASTAVGIGVSMLKSAAGEPADLLRLNLKAGEKSSVAFVALAQGASEGYKAGEDIFKLFSPIADVPEIYTVADKTAIEINVTDTGAGDMLIPVGIKTNQTGTMNLEITGAGNVQSAKEIYLIDREKNKKYDLRSSQTAISFEKESADDYLEGRFYLSFEAAGGTPTGSGEQPDAAGAIQVFVNNGYVTVSSSEEITGLKLYDLSGKMIYSLAGSGKYIEKFAMPQSGVSILTIETTERIENRKIIF